MSYFWSRSYLLTYAVVKITGIKKDLKEAQATNKSMF